MKNLIIFAHPGGKRHGPAVLEEVKKALDSKKENYLVLDLYRMKFDPVLKLVDLQNYEHTPKYVKNLQGEIKKAKRLIFIYPHWWGGMPAILKGFFERVFTRGFAFEFKGKMPKPLLKGKEAIVFRTLGGPKFFQLFTGNPDLHTIKTSILKFCGMKTKVHSLDRCGEYSIERLPKIKEMVGKALD